MDAAASSAPATIIADGLATTSLLSCLVSTMCCMTMMYLSFKGMCRFTEGDNPLIFFFKWFVNSLVGGLLGIIMFFVKGQDCAQRANGRPNVRYNYRLPSNNRGKFQNNTNRHPLAPRPGLPTGPSRK